MRGKTVAVVAVAGSAVLFLVLPTFSSHLAGNLANVYLVHKLDSLNRQTDGAGRLHCVAGTRGTGRMYRDIVVGLTERRYARVYDLLQTGGLREGRRQMIAQHLGFLLFERGTLSEAVRSWKLLGGRELDRTKERLLEVASAGGTGDRAVAERSYRALCLLEPGSRGRYEALAGFLLRDGRRDDAVEVLEQGRAQATGADSVFLAGRAAEERKEWHTAGACYRQAYELNDEFMSARYRLAQILAYHLGPRGEAIEICEDIIGAAPGFYGGYELLAWLYRVEGQERSAIRWLRRGIGRVDGDNHRSALGGKLGRLLLEAGDLEEAQYHLERAVELEAYNADAHYDLGRIYHARGDLQSAAASYEEAVRRAAARGRAVPAWESELREACEHMSARSARPRVQLPDGTLDRE